MKFVTFLTIIFFLNEFILAKDKPNFVWIISEYQRFIIKNMISEFLLHIKFDEGYPDLEYDLGTFM